MANIVGVDHNKDVLYVSYLRSFPIIQRLLWFIKLTISYNVSVGVVP